MLNRSCERCRVKKLRCNGDEPCTMCISTNSQCMRVLRKKKTMRSKMKAATSGVDADASKSQTSNGDDQQTSPLASSPSPSDSSAMSSSQMSPWSGLHNNEQNQNNAAAASSSTSAHSTTSDRHLANKKASIGNLGPTHAASSLFAGPAYRAKPSLYPDDLDTLLHEARAAIGYSLDACVMILQLSARWRVSPAVNGCVHIPTIIEYLTEIFEATDKQMPAAALRHNLTVDHVILTLLMMSTSVLFTPPNGTSGEVLRIAMMLSTRLPNNDPSERHRAMYALATRLMKRRLKELDCSMEGVLSIILLILQDHEDIATTEELSDRALRWAMQLGMHRIQGYELLDELKVRAWWYLVVRSWLAGPVCWAYTIHPAQFTTRKPLNVEDSDLEKGLGADTLKAISRIHSPASYGLAIIELASTVRELVDIRVEIFQGVSSATSSDDPATVELITQKQHSFQQRIVKGFDALAPRLSWIYAIDKEFNSNVAREHCLAYAQGGRIEIERWLVHQQIFHCFLELHDVNAFINDEVPASCVKLANHILSTVDLYARHCSVVSASGLPARSITTAATILTVHALNMAHHLDLQYIDEYISSAAAAAKARRLVRQDAGKRNLERLERMVAFWKSSLSQAEGNGMEKSGAQIVAQAQAKIDEAVERSFRPGGILNTSPKELWQPPKHWSGSYRWSPASSSSAASTDPTLAARPSPLMQNFSSMIAAGGADALETLGAAVEPMSLDTIDIDRPGSNGQTGSSTMVPSPPMPSLTKHIGATTNFPKQHSMQTASDASSMPPLPASSVLNATLEGLNWNAAFDSSASTSSATSMPSLAAIGPAFQLDMDDAAWESLYKSIVEPTAA